MQRDRLSGRLTLKKGVPVLTDTDIAHRYLNKIRSCTDSGIPFCLSLQSFINLSRAKKCYYTGLPLTKNTITIDRVDASLGYENGNVVACHTAFNSFKGMIENGSNPLTYENCLKGMKKLSKRL